VKFFVLLLCLVGLAPVFGQQQTREADFDIRFEPSAVLQTGVEIPFKITVKNTLHQPVHGAAVTLQIETSAHEHTKVFRATETDTGTYVAKPLFPVSGQWNVYVEVRRDDEMSARTIEFNVPK